MDPALVLTFRNPKFFDSILDLYRTGKFVVANDIPLELMREELKFWKLKIEGEEEEETEEEPAQPKTPEAAFNMAFALLQGRSRWEIREGIKILEGLLIVYGNTFRITTTRRAF